MFKLSPAAREKLYYAGLAITRQRISIPFATVNDPTRRGLPALRFLVNGIPIDLGGRYVVEVATSRVHSEVSDQTYPAVYYWAVVTVWDLVGIVAELVAFSDVYSDANRSHPPAQFLREPGQPKLFHPLILSFGAIERVDDNRLAAGRLTLRGLVDQGTAHYFGEM
jgi:hypothetical protein